MNENRYNAAVSHTALTVEAAAQFLKEANPDFPHWREILFTIGMACISKATTGIYSEADMFIGYAFEELDTACRLLKRELNEESE